MKEYEFIVSAIEEVLSDRLIALICLENYGIQSQPEGYMALFDQYATLQKQYKECIIADCSDELSKERYYKFKQQWEKEREEMFDSFIRDLNADRDINAEDIAKYKDKYEEILKKEEIQTLGKRIAMYPYLVSSVCK